MTIGFHPRTAEHWQRFKRVFCVQKVIVKGRGTGGTLVFYDEGDVLPFPRKGGEMKSEAISRHWLLLGVRLLMLAAVCALLLGVPGRARAAEEQRTLVPLGSAVGIKLFSSGVMVVGLSEVATDSGGQSPARDCGLKEGDIITHINSEQVDTIEAVQEVLQELEGEPMSIRAVRAGRQLQLTGEAVQCASDGTYKLGAWIRDSMAGIGTLTWYDPETGVFAALGHGINDVDTNLLMPLQSGSIMTSTVTDVQKGEQGAPGQLQGAFELESNLGDLYANTAGGIFGLATEDLDVSAEALPVASRAEVRTGAAVIRANVSGSEVKEYEVEILRVYPESESETRDLMIRVTDPELLEATGGIVQGMSGSPIIQNGMLVGAVTHVLVNDPTCGYGILAETMLECC